jgi:serine/arginine repetitive matrix protein 2
MYNGIGLLTPRGSGTSGHVTSNAFNIRSGQRITERKDDGKKGPVVKKADEKILEHQRKRAIEVKLAELEEDLQDKGCALSTACQFAAHF